MSDDRLCALEANIAQLGDELRALRLANEALVQEAAKARRAIKLIGPAIDAHEALLLSIVDAMPGVEADIEAALARPGFARLVGANVVTQIHEFRRQLDWWRSLVDCGRPEGGAAH